MQLSTTFLKIFLNALTKHAIFLALMLGILFDGWLGWQDFEQWTEKPLPEERVMAQQLRVNTSQLQKLKASLQAYQQPQPIPKLPTIKFFKNQGNKE